MLKFYVDSGLQEDEEFSDEIINDKRIHWKIFVLLLPVIMANCNMLRHYPNIFVFICIANAVMAQEENICYGPGSIAVSVILTLILGTIIAAIVFFFWRKYWDARKGKHLILESDPEKGKGEYAFDNPGFKDAGYTPVIKTVYKAESGNKINKWNQWSPLGAISIKNDRKRTQDDIAIEDQVKVVSLRSHDFTGLGFNIYGNMKEGIYIKDILNRGPAHESRKLNAGDRITCIAINFEHMVYEDALTILSYASPYEVTVCVRNGKNVTYTGQADIPGHPLYKSSSCVDLVQIGKSAKKRLFHADDVSEIGSNYSSLQNFRSTATTLERKGDPMKGKTSQHLKTRLEEKIIDGQKENMRTKLVLEKCSKVDLDNAKVETRHQKFGIKVFPNVEIQQKSQNLIKTENNSNLNYKSSDEVDRNDAPLVKKREKTYKPPESQDLPEPFERENIINSSGIKRDSNNIPLEIPNNMYNAALVARKNRKSVDEDELKSPKKSKGKAPAPPEFKLEGDGNKTNVTISTIDLIRESSNDSMDKNNSDSSIINIKGDYNSDSDIETDTQSSVNTIELNQNDITIHQSEECEEKQNRRTASTGDLTKIHKTRKTSSGTLERAQSLDITDGSIPTLTKKRIIGNTEDVALKTSSGESLYDDVLMNKEPRLSVILDGLNTFQRSRLKKSTEWGNLEDAILKEDKHVVDGSSESIDKQISCYDDYKVSSGNLKTLKFGEKSAEFEALVSKINEIKQEAIEIINEQERNLNDIQLEISPDEITDISDIPESMQTMSKTIEDMAKSIEAVTIESMEDITGVKKNKNQIWPFQTKEDDNSKMNNESNIDIKTFETNKIDESKRTSSNKANNISSMIFDIEKKHFDNKNELHMKYDANTKNDEHSIKLIEVNKKNNVENDYPSSHIPIDIDTEKTNFTIKSRFNEIEMKVKEVVTVPLVNVTQINRDSKTTDGRESEIDLKPLEFVKNINDNNRTQSGSNIIDKNTDGTKTFATNTNKTTENLVDSTKTKRDFSTETKLDLLNQLEVSLKPTDKVVKNISTVLKDVNTFIQTEREFSNQNYITEFHQQNVDKPNDIKVYMHSSDSSELQKFTENTKIDNISNITIYNPKKTNYQANINKTEITNNFHNDSNDNITLMAPDVIKNISMAETYHEVNNEVTIEGPTSLTFEISGNEKFVEGDVKNYKESEMQINNNLNKVDVTAEVDKNKSSMSYITEIQVTTPQANNSNISEIELTPALERVSIEKSVSKDFDHDFEKYMKTFESNIKNFESNINNFEQNIQEATQIAKKETTTFTPKNIVIPEKVDPEKELLKVQEIVEEQLKKLPEMRFTTTSYESQKQPSELRQSQIEILRSNFEKNTSPPRVTKSETSPPKSRIPILNKTPPTSPERRNSKNLETEPDKEILEIMSSHIPMVSSLKYVPKATSRNITVTSIRSNSKIPSGLPTYSTRPPVPPRKNECDDNVMQVSTNANSDNFKQWVFNPTDSAVTSITLTTDTKFENK